MKKILFITSYTFLAFIFSISNAYAFKTITVSSWDIKIQDDKTCALGKTFNFGKRDDILIAITSYGQVSILADKPFKGKIKIDKNKSIKPTNTLSSSMYMYSNSDNQENGKLFISLFKKGNFASIKLKSGETRKLNLSGFSKAYKRYKKCSRF